MKVCRYQTQQSLTARLSGTGVVFFFFSIEDRGESLISLTFHSLVLGENLGSSILQLSLTY